MFNARKRCPQGLVPCASLWNIRSVNYDLLTVGDDSSPQRTVTLELVAGHPCGAGECPTIYKTDRGTLVVQGYTLLPANAGVELPPGEQMVEIPTELVADYVRTVSS